MKNVFIKPCTDSSDPDVWILVAEDEQGTAELFDVVGRDNAERELKRLKRKWKIV